MAHHTHFVQTGLSIEKNETNGSPRQPIITADHKLDDSLSILEMSLHDPPILEESIRSLVVPQVYTFTRVPNNISCSWIC